MVLHKLKEAETAREVTAQIKRPRGCVSRPGGKICVNVNQRDGDVTPVLRSAEKCTGLNSVRVCKYKPWNPRLAATKNKWRTEVRRYRAGLPTAGTGAALHYANQEHSPHKGGASKSGLCHQKSKRNVLAALADRAMRSRAQQCCAPM
jgi:hypothetical protein